MKVYVVESGEYAERGVVGVYPSFEAVQRAYPDEKWRDIGSEDDAGFEAWENEGQDKHLDRALSISAHELVGVDDDAGRLRGT